MTINLSHVIRFPSFTMQYCNQAGQMIQINYDTYYSTTRLQVLVNGLALYDGSDAKLIQKYIDQAAKYHSKTTMIKATLTGNLLMRLLLQRRLELENEV